MGMQKGFKLSPITKKRISDAKIGKIPPNINILIASGKNTRFNGSNKKVTQNRCRYCHTIFDVLSKDRNNKFCSRECRIKGTFYTSSWMKGKTAKDLSPEYRKKLSDSKSRENNPRWLGGKSLEGYSVDWTSALKKSIRQRDKYTCGICGIEPAIDVHHIDYNKLNCDPNNLITLCHSCHIRTNAKRDYWIKYLSFSQEREVIK